MSNENLAVTLSRPFRKALTTNANSSSFPSKVPTITEPTNDGVIDLKNVGLTIPQKMLVLPYGLGSDNDVFDLRVIAWRLVGVLWVPYLLGKFTCTISAAVGVAGADVLNTERFADTITVGNEPTVTADVTRQGTVQVMSPTGDLVAYLIIELNGAAKVEFIFDQTTGTPTTNCLIAFF
jgi:hypothetical protein